MFTFCMKNQKSVEFNNNVNIILIPCLDEYYQNQLNDSLWWSLSDIHKFKLNYQNQIHKIMHMKDVSIFDAKKLIES